MPLYRISGKDIGTKAEDAALVSVDLSPHYIASAVAAFDNV